MLLEENIRKLNDRIVILEKEIEKRDEEIKKLKEDINELKKNNGKLDKIVEELQKEKEERNILFSIGQILSSLKTKFQEAYADENKNPTYIQTKIIRGKEKTVYNYDQIPNLSEIINEILREEQKLKEERRKRTEDEQKTYISDMNLIKKNFSEQNSSWIESEKNDKELLECIQELLKFSKSRNEEAHSLKPINETELQIFLKSNSEK